MNIGHSHEPYRDNWILKDTAVFPLRSKKRE